MNWYTNRKHAKWAKMLSYTEERIAHLSETLGGIEEDVWPEDHQELLEERTRLAWKRSDLILKLGGFTA